ncbi:MAG: helix-turn-helix domain-containing protein [Deltaproteobacteria bacterium]|nr:helix-turn-helix domain-containing protein [Deltaproteobacteria bacterium]
MQDEINPHEILEIAPGASRGEIERAYYLARLAYGSDSLASYSLYSPGERTLILDRIERAYQLLLDEPTGAPPGATSAGDDARAAGREAPAGATPRAPVPPADEFGEAGAGARGNADGNAEGSRVVPAGPPPVRSREPVRPVPVRPQIEATDVSRPYVAGALHQIRKSRGLKLEEIVTQTRISLKNLRLIESGDYDQLPSVVYLRGYLTQYANCLRLSPADVLADYLEAIGGASGGKGGKPGKHE